MRKIAVLAALLCTLVSAQAAEPASAQPAQHPLAGSWSWTLPGKQCTETLRYLANGTLMGSSGEEALQSRYEVSAMPSLLGFYRLDKTVAKSNGKPDCAGDLHGTSEEPATRFIQFSPKRDQFIVCKEESLKACFGPLKRLPQ